MEFMRSDRAVTQVGATRACFRKAGAPQACEAVQPLRVRHDPKLARAARYSRSRMGRTTSPAMAGAQLGPIASATWLVWQSARRTSVSLHQIRLTALFREVLVRGPTIVAISVESDGLNESRRAGS